MFKAEIEEGRSYSFEEVGSFSYLEGTITNKTYGQK